MANILIFGAGRSGIGAAILAKAKGYSVIVYDNNTIQSNYIEELNRYNIQYTEGNHGDKILENIELIVKSPGIPSSNELLVMAKSRNIPIIGDVEFAAGFTKAKLIGITGTNGKTTTTCLTYHLLKTAQVSISMAGNIGRSFALAVLEDSPEYFILELSSFQLEDMYKAKLHIACILNITPDHLDRHTTIQNYVDTKFRILQNMTPQDHFIYNAKDSNIINHMSPNNGIYPKMHPIEASNDIFDLPTTLRGKHNKLNADAAITIASLLGIDNSIVQKALITFPGVAHRIQYVADINGVTFYNDSKATNIDSARVALESFKEPVVWIAGGYDKGNNYEDIYDLVKRRVKAIVCLTKDSEKITALFSKIITVYTTQSVNEAVSKAYSFANHGYVVLLSPACASFDLFNNYEHRGNEYIEAVQNFKQSIHNEL
jgi:UDP-N-acetylmuramoylalanine--D-glutamate ligase